MAALLGDLGVIYCFMRYILLNIHSPYGRVFLSIPGWNVHTIPAYLNLPETAYVTTPDIAYVMTLTKPMSGP